MSIQCRLKTHNMSISAKRSYEKLFVNKYNKFIVVYCTRIYNIVSIYQTGITMLTLQRTIFIKYYEFLFVGCYSITSHFTYDLYTWLINSLYQPCVLNLKNQIFRLSH